MKNKKKITPAPAARGAAAAVAPKPRIQWWHYAAAAFLGLFLVFQVYSPALHGDFVFDDSYLPMRSPNVAGQPLASWISGVRPMLMLSYWMNYHGPAETTTTYHAWNILYHFGNALLVFLIARKLFGFAKITRQRLDLPLFAAAIFLLHPAQTESVAYIAGRSESLSALFFLAAFTVFLYRRSPGISWLAAAGIVLLFGCALATKEHTITLPALLLLTDYYWNPGFRFEGIRKNWKLYVPIVVGGLGGAAFVLKRIGLDASAGLGVQGITPLDYLFTQFRVIFSYIRLFFLPVGLNADYDVAFSRSIADHGAWLGMIGLIALVIAAWWYRKRFPMESYGILVFLLLLAPTSSIVPIQDPMADRRLYLPMIGLLLTGLSFVGRLVGNRKTAAISLSLVVLAFAVATFQRSRVWAGTLPLWEDTVTKSPGKGRVHFQLAHAYYLEGRCQEALSHYETVGKLQKPDHRLLVDWGLAYDCLNRPDDAIAKLEEAAALEQTAHVYAEIGRVNGKAGRGEAAARALDTAIKTDPNYDMSYVYLGHLFAASNDMARAVENYRKALSINPGNAVARDALLQVQRRPTGR